VITSPKPDALKVALPKGNLMGDLSRYMGRVGFVVPGYDERNRVYRLASERPRGAFVKVFSEKDIPIQVAVGNYDIGIAGNDWITEHTIKYSKIAIVRVIDLGFGSESLFAAASPGITLDSLKEESMSRPIRLVSEYPNIAEHFAAYARFFRYRVFPIWGAAEAYVPEFADIIVIRGGTKEEIASGGFSVISEIMRSEATVIAHRASFETRDLSSILDVLGGGA